MHGTAGPIDFNVHQPNWKLASRLVRTFGGANDDGHECVLRLRFGLFLRFLYTTTNRRRVATSPSASASIR